MNMKKTIGVCATLLTVLLCAVPQSARATGKIRAVDVCSLEADGRTLTPLKPGSVLGAGATFYVRFRMVNVGWEQTAHNHDYTNPWRFTYIGPSFTGNYDYDTNLLARAGLGPSLGLWVGDSVREAECFNFPLDEASDWLSVDKGDGTPFLPDERHYTDLVFKYTVQAGDIALPLQLADAIAGPAKGASGYYLARQEYWALVDSRTSSVTNAPFQFGPFNLAEDSDFAGTDLSTWDIVSSVEQAGRDLDLTRSGIYIQAIDFDKNFADEGAGIWRDIKKGKTHATPKKPTIEIPGRGVPKEMELYLWTADTNIAEIVQGGNVVDVTPTRFHDGTVRNVGKVKLEMYKTSVEFDLKATGAIGDQTQVFLSATSNDLVWATGDVITNFITRTIRVVDPGQPGMIVKLTEQDAVSDGSVTAPTNTRAVVSIDVELDEEYPGGRLAIPIKVTADANPSLDVTQFLGLSTVQSDDNTTWDDTLYVESGKTTAEGNLLWMYANRGTSETAGGIRVEVDTNRLDAAARAFFAGKYESRVIVVKPSTPVIVKDLNTPPLPALKANEERTITTKVDDAWGEKRAPCKYTVRWSYDGTAEYTSITGLTATADGEISFPVTYSDEGEYNSSYYVINEDGESSESRSVRVTVAGQNLVVALLERTRFPEDAVSDEGQDVLRLYFKNGADPTKGFRMSNGATEAFVHFVPRDWNASNLVDCADFNSGDQRWVAGIPVYAGTVTNEVPIAMRLLDGSRTGLTMGFGIEVRTADGRKVEEWSSNGFSFGVTNVVPQVTQVSMSGTRLKVNGGTMPTPASVGVSKVFTALTSEPSDEDIYADKPGYTDDQKAFTTEWTFDFGSGTPETKYVYGPPSTPLTNTFTRAGTCTVTVRMRDKDMDHNRDVWGPEFTFTVEVNRKPTVTLAPYNGLSTFYEDQVGEAYGKLKVGLSMEPEEEVTVHLVVQRAGADDGNYPLPVLNSYDITFGGSSPYTTEADVWFTELDGTAQGSSRGYFITAVVTNTTKNADGMAWTNLYAGATLPVNVVNIDPIIETGGTNNTIVAWKSVDENFTIDFRVKDVPADLSVDAGMTVTWITSDGFTTNYPISVNSSSGQYAYAKEKSPTLSFSSSGNKVVTLIVEDKDGGFDQEQWFYYVEPSKALLIYPRKNKYITAFAKRYNRVAGDGRVWAVDGSVSQFSGFIHKYTYSPTKPTADIFARGYKVGEVDDGSLQPRPDIEIDAGGNHYKNGSYSSYYTSAGNKGRDSFFYCWILDSKGEGSGRTGTWLGGFSPAVEPRGAAVGELADGRSLVDLPEYEEDSQGYDDTVLEAIFALEQLTSDNLGDINQDGIPDIFAVEPGRSGNVLVDFASGGADGGETDSVNDLTTLTDFNGDADFLPADSMQVGNILVTADSWTAVGEPFTAELEVRGFDRHLNFRMEDDNEGYNVNVYGAWVSDPCFSEAETNAVAFWNGLTTLAEFKKAHAEDDEDAYADALAEWQTAFNAKLEEPSSWIPENRTDPTVDDTDKDGFPDGYEYYFWYMAKVGWMDAKGNWTRLEGERFQLEDIAKGVPISSAEIVTNFNPTVAAGKFDAAKRDTDGDGLTDMEELAIGTNPVHWDSDGDGMSDQWEVLRGLNPLKKDADANEDGDFMAIIDLPENYAILTFTTNGVTESWAVPNNGAGYVDAKKSELLQSATGTVSCIKVYRYGNDTSPWTPVGRWSRGKTDVMLPVPGLEKMQQIDLGPILEAAGDAGVVALTGQHLRLVHDQVYAQCGFDPRTGWSKTDGGYVADRWDVSKPSAQHARATGVATNTTKFTAIHEYLLLKYRYNTRPLHSKYNPEDESDTTYSVSRDKASIQSGKATMANVLALGTTNPSAPYEGKVYGTLGASASSGSGDEEGEEGESDAGADPTTHTDTNHGSDTDGDGVPDGWELYVGHNPNSSADADLADDDADKLGLVAEYAGTDSCDAYAFATNGVGALTVHANHPGIKSGWYNKFFPTDPWSDDTDGDGIIDGDEGATWVGAFRYGNTGSGAAQAHTYTFIYGPEQLDDHPEGKPDKDDGTICIRGGGLNPCTVDTDGDMLPDPWEREFAGVVFTAEGRPVNEGELEDSHVNLIRRSDGLKSNAAAKRPYITAGMDGTHGFRMENAVQTGDAYTRQGFEDPFTGTERNYDFDHDGLQNYQEYLVQSLRHLRYDDSSTPLMGQWMPEGTRQFFAFVPMNVMDGETFYAKVQAAGFPITGAFKFNEIGYFARPANEWDLAAQNDYLKNGNYDDYGFRVMLRPQFTRGSGSSKQTTKASSYCSTDPRMQDSDQDGMDDYYEIFHGLNPLLGSVDVIAGAYGYRISYWYNAWTGWPLMNPFGDGNSPYDAMKYPWMMGVPEADADGDGVINSDEALLVNLASPQPAHTDPTPLWMTDSTGKAGYTIQYYQADSDASEAMRSSDFAQYPWDFHGMRRWMFSFEENEGYDTDHDGLNDLSERTTTGTVTSDPLDSTDPDRRQALWFPGNQSAAVSYNSRFQRGPDFLKKFTVEAWICPENVSKEQVILERVVNCEPDTLSNNVAKVRANFRIGITADGYLYGQFDTTDAIETGSGDSSPKVVSVFKAEAGKWTHVALSYNASLLTLYIDGKVANTFQTTLSPATGVTVLGQDAVGVNNEDGSWEQFAFPVSRSRSTQSAVVLGARIRAATGFMLTEETTWADYDSFYAGYVDEVRVWDDVRTAGQIVEAMKRRFSFADIKALREEVYASWQNAGTHNDNDGYPNLPAELVMHYNFQTLYGAVNPSDVAHEPVGFTKNVIDNVRVDGGDVPGGLQCGWWYALKDTVGSTVYKNYHIVPWIPNTCAHLPFMDGSSPDSQYWSKYFGGVGYASEVLPRLGLDSTATEQSFVFANSANPYPYYFDPGDDAWYHGHMLFRLEELDRGYCSAKRDLWLFEERTRLSGCSDLVPLGGAFAKRAAEMWDGDGAATAWELSGWDDNNNGIPDWWEKVATDNYGAPSGFAWDSMLVRGGVEMSAREAYLRDLAGGMLPGGAIDAAYSTKADTNNNGLPDWWENLYGVKSATEDKDGDGLSNYAEFLIGEGFVNYGFPRVNPVMPHSLGQAVPDYFLRVGQLYLGEMFADHDMMEDAWEDQFDVGKISRAVWDAQGDPDGDGWSNFAEARANTDPTRQNVSAIDDYTVPQYPVPTVTVTVTGESPLDGPIVVKAYPVTAGGTDIPDAIWTTGASDEAFTKYIGINPNTVWRATLGPGAVKPGSLAVYFKDPTWYQGTPTNRVYGTLSTAEWMLWLSDKSRSGSSVMGDVVTQNINYYGETVGWINYETGEVEVDFTKLQGGVTWAQGDKNGSGTGTDKYIHLAPSYVYLGWSSKVPQGNSSITLGLADSRASTSKYKSLGHLREREYIFTALLDKNDNGEWDPGELYGAVSHVDVGWSGTSCAIKLTETTPQMVRINVAGAIKAKSFNEANALTDRGGMTATAGFFSNEPSLYPGTNMPENASSLTKVRVVRNWINGEAGNGSQSYSSVVLERDLDLTQHPNLTEAELLVDGVYDLDWGTLLPAYGGGAATLEKVTYRIVIGNDELADYERFDNNLSLLFSNQFEGRLRQTPTVPDPALPQIVYAGQPTFRWSHANSINKAYPAFQLRIYAADQSTVVYDSGVQQAPVRDANGMYEWTAPVFVGQILSAPANYYWAVSMLDAKFTFFNDDEVKTPFRMECTGDVNDGRGYGSIKVAVKYFGPLAGSLSTSASALKNLIHVQAFTTPDFTGTPVGEAFVTDVASVSSTSDMTVNAIVRGVKPGTYYVRAFVDTDSDWRRSSWETWGYGCYVGDGSAPFITITRGNGASDGVSAANFPYTPHGYTVAVGAAVPEATIYMEDSDTDFDGFPDAWEMNTYGTLATHTPISGNTFFATVNPSLLATLSGYTLGSTISGSTANLGFSLMSALQSGSDDAVAMVADLLSPGARGAEGTMAVGIKSFSLEDGLTLEITNETAPVASDLITFKDEANVQLYLVCASSPDFADAVEVPVKEITIRANDTVVEAVSGDALADARAKVPDARFFKAVIKAVIR